MFDVSNGRNFYGPGELSERRGEGEERMICEMEDVYRWPKDQTAASSSGGAVGIGVALESDGSGSEWCMAVVGVTPAAHCLLTSLMACVTDSEKRTRPHGDVYAPRM